MTFLWPLIVRAGLFLLVMLVLGAVARWFLVRRGRRRTKEREAVPRCVCGYPLEGLNMARCPECGRVSGFNATAEELGLSAEELQRAAETRRRRAGERPPP